MKRKLRRKLKQKRKRKKLVQVEQQLGQIYIPGFGWVENHGGGGSGSVVEIYLMGHEKASVY